MTRTITDHSQNHGTAKKTPNNSNLKTAIKRQNIAAVSIFLNEIIKIVTSSPMGNDRSPGSQHNVWRHHNYYRCSKAGQSELETVIRNKFNNSIYYASFRYLNVLKKSE